MRTISKEFIEQLNRGNRKFLCYADITLKDSISNPTVFHLTNSEIMVGGFSYEDAISDDDSFNALGAVVINSAKLIINNTDDVYSTYDFTNAEVVLSLGLQLSNTLETIKIGTYTVDDANYTGGRIHFTLLDFMEQFDRDYVTNLAYPATLYEIVADCCQKCGIILATTTFPHYNYEVTVKPDSDNTTYRDVISWCATIAGCYARCDKDGKLELKWFNTDIISNTDNKYDGGRFDNANPYASGDTVDGGLFNPWNEGTTYDGGLFTEPQNYHLIYALKRQNINVDDTVITGIQIIVEGENSSNSRTENHVIIDVGDRLTTYTLGDSDYVIVIQDNDFITNTNAVEIITWLGLQLINLRFRKLNVDCLANPSIEAGDVGFVYDRKSNEYPVLISRSSFAVGHYQTIVSASETPLRNSGKRFSEATRNYLKTRKILKEEKTARELALRELADQLAEKNGLYTTVETPQSGGNIYYLHEKPTLEESKIVWKMTANAWGVTTNYRGAQTVWNAGLTVDGNLIANILNANGVNAGWIRTGKLQSQDGSVYIDLDRNEIYIKGKTFLTASDVGANGSTVVDGGRITTGIIQGGGTSGNPNFKLIMSTGELTMKRGSIDLGSKFKVNNDGTVYFEKGSSGKQRLIIQQALIRGQRRNSASVPWSDTDYSSDGDVVATVGTLDLCANYTNPFGEGSSLETVLASKTALFIKAHRNREISFQMGNADDSNLSQPLKITRSKIEASVPIEAELHHSGGANKYVYLAYGFDGAGQATTWNKFQIVDGVLVGPI